MNPFGNLPYPPESFKPVEKMLLQELVYMIVIAKLSAAVLKMLDPIETCILELWLDILFYAAALNVGYSNTRSVYATYVLL